MLNELLRGADGDLPDETAISARLKAACDLVEKEGPGQNLELVLPGGQTRWITAWSDALEHEGHPARLVWMQDVTSLRRAEREALQAVRTQAAFLMTMSHEIRTPMNGVCTMAALLAQTPVTPDQAEMIQMIVESGDALLHILKRYSGFF